MEIPDIVEFIIFFIFYFIFVTTVPTKCGLEPKWNLFKIIKKGRNKE